MRKATSVEHPLEAVTAGQVSLVGEVSENHQGRVNCVSQAKGELSLGACLLVGRRQKVSIKRHW